MRLPIGVTFHFGSRVWREGDEVPPELEARLPEEIRVPKIRAVAVEAKTVTVEAKADDGAGFSPGGRRK